MRKKNGAMTSGQKLHAKGGHAAKKLEEWVQGMSTSGLKTDATVRYQFKIMREGPIPTFSEYQIIVNGP